MLGGRSPLPLALPSLASHTRNVQGERWCVDGAEVVGDGPGPAGVLRALRARAYGWPGEVQGSLAPFAAWLADGAGLPPEACAGDDDEAVASALLGALERKGLARPLLARVLAFAPRQRPRAL